jgi:hypothetical protein
MIKKISLIALLLTFTPYAHAIGANLEELTVDDQWTYDYFDSILTGFALVLENLVYEKSNTTKESHILYYKIDNVKKEVVYYKSLNVSSPSEHVYPPFLTFSKELVRLCILDNKLRMQLKEKTPENIAMAKITINEMMGTINVMYGCLDEIDNIRILKKGDKILLFDTSKVRKYLNLYVLKLLKLMSSAPPALTIGVSDSNPILYEKVIIYGTSDKDNDKINIHIVNDELGIHKKYELTSSKYSFSKEISFDKLGSYEIYATEGDKFSNIVVVNVSKIPVDIITDETITAQPNENITISGTLVDYYNKVIDGAVYVGNKSILCKNGRFSTIVHLNTSANISVRYPGDEMHSPSEKNIKLIIYSDVPYYYENVSLIMMEDIPIPIPWYGYIIFVFILLIVILVICETILLLKIRKIMISSKKLVILLKKIYHKHMKYLSDYL